MLEILSLRIQVIQNDIRIPLMTCSKDKHLEKLIRKLQTFFSIGSDVESSIKNFARLKIYV